MDFPKYDCSKVGYLRKPLESDSFHDRALEKASEKTCIF